jgi:predicted ATP-dependent protease
MKKVLIPKANAEDVYLAPERLSKIEVVPVQDIVEVLEIALAEGSGKKTLMKKMKGI